MGYEELPHTADYALRVWGRNLPELFSNAALGLNALAGICLGPGPRLERDIRIEGTDDESLLVAFLSELLYLQETEALGFDQFSLAISGGVLTGILHGARLTTMSGVIKAVTFHSLKIERTSRGREAIIIFDV